MHLCVLQILTERSLGRQVGSGRDRSTSRLRVKAKKARMQPQFGQNMPLLRSRCVGDARNTLTDPGGAGASRLTV